MYVSTMTTKTIKSYALFAMVPLLLAGFGGNAFAAPESTSYSAEAVNDAFDAIKPYVTINDEKIASIDVREATKKGISNEDIKNSKEFLRMQNKMIQDIHDNPEAKMVISNEDQEKFSKFFDGVRNNEVGDVTIASCNYNGPHDQPDVTTTGSYSSRTAAVDALSSGYNQVPAYASGNHPDDYADWVSAYGCADGIFRYQTIVFDAGSDWQHSNQHSPGEPNPEVLAYGWPVWWWSGYVYTWHNP